LLELYPQGLNLFDHYFVKAQEYSVLRKYRIVRYPIIRSLMDLNLLDRFFDPHCFQVFDHSCCNFNIINIYLLDANES